MSYNLKCCSFYPNNFDASALSDDYCDERNDAKRCKLEFLIF